MIPMSTSVFMVFSFLCVIALAGHPVIAHEISGSESFSTAILDDPWNDKTPDSTPEIEFSFEQDIARLMAGLYRNCFNSALSSGCPSYPSCSEYMVQSVTRFGIIPGIVLSLERMLHEMDRITSGELIMVDDQLRIFDPIENNVWWWKKSR
jgi:putative component of membrane protein insertase Oxa1/YidC/SpoIIIJ protein YidD